MLGWWRGMIMGIFVFAAVATPSTDPLTMMALAGPIWVLYFVAVGFSLLNDRRKRRNDPDAEPDDDEASDLDLTPEDIGEVETVSASRALPEQASARPTARASTATTTSPDRRSRMRPTRHAGRARPGRRGRVAVRSGAGAGACELGGPRVSGTGSG